MDEARQQQAALQEERLAERLFHVRNASMVSIWRANGILAAGEGGNGAEDAPPVMLTQIEREERRLADAQARRVSLIEPMSQRAQALARAS
jgi:phage terminase Nu1 subunit (DNA packaging protein)|eukprot:3227308-Prymnesium_polylepis.2